MIELTADTKEFSSILDELLSDLSNAPHEVRKLAFDFLNFSTELVSFEFSITSGTTMAALLKPTQRLLDLCLAVRTGDFDLIIVKHSHCDEPPKIVCDETSNVGIHRLP